MPAETDKKDNSTRNSKLIHASAETIYKAFVKPHQLEKWMAPDNMTARLHHFNWKEGGGYELSLLYPEADKVHQGKTAAKEDRYEATILKLIPDKLIILAISFDSKDPLFTGEMTLEITLDEKENGTTVTFAFKNIPEGIKAGDNEKGTISTLEKLAQYAEAKEEIDEQDSDGSANAFEDK